MLCILMGRMVLGENAGVGTLDATIHPASWLNDLAWQVRKLEPLRLSLLQFGTYVCCTGLICKFLTLQISELGAPVRHLHLRDLLLPAEQIDPVLQHLKLVVFPNAFTLSDSLKAAISKLQAKNRTREAPSIIRAVAGTCCIFSLSC